VIDVNTFSLEYILDYLPMNHFGCIEHVKTDCEGLDIRVIKSLGKYLTKVVFITSELNSNFSQAEKEEFVEDMNMNGFGVIKYDGGNINFINVVYLKEVQIFQLSNHTLGL